MDFDQDVMNLLEIWGLPDLIPAFTDNEINLQALSALTPDTISDLIPKIGPRALFLRCWKSWHTEFNSRNVSLSSLDLDLPNNVIVVPSDVQELSDYIDSQINQQTNDDEKIQTEQTPDKGPSPKPKKSPVLDTPECRALEKLLKGSVIASVLLNYKGSKLDGDSSRNLLVAEIAKEILRLNQNNAVIRGETYFRWANAIKSLFPGENTTTYYVPACTTANGIVLQARGKLVYQVLNLRKRLQKLGALTKQKRNISTETSESSSRASPRPAPSFLENVDEQEAPTVEEDLNWLRNSSDPWSLVLVKWKNTTKERMRKLHEENVQLAQTIQSYFEEYPALKKPHGYTLLISDFEQAYGEFKDNLFIHFPIVKNLLCEILTKRKKDKDALCAEVLELTHSGAEEDINLAGFLAIVQLLSFSAATSSQKKKRLKTEKTNCWKPTKIEAQNAFIKHVKADTEINDAIESRYENLRKRGSSSQPFIIIVGETLNKIKSYFVVANRNVLYERYNILETVDTCYKTFWALNAVYNIESYPIWLFVQKGMYRMTSKYDKGSTSVDSLLTDCNLNL